MAKKIAILSLAFLCFAFGLGAVTLYQDAQLYHEVIRFHVLANSDTEEDQILKLAVRDAVLLRVDEISADCETVQDAKSALMSHADEILQTARQTVAQKGYDYPVSISFGPEAYPTRYYEGMQFPAGTYESVRLVIGEGQGQNWWCVLFPPLCVDASCAKEEMVQSGFTQSQIKILTERDNPRYVLRFRALEVLEEWKNSFR
jgi:stage II sporulation protein R